MVSSTLTLLSHAHNPLDLMQCPSAKLESPWPLGQRELMHSLRQAGQANSTNSLAVPTPQVYGSAPKKYPPPDPRLNCGCLTPHKN